ncbi:MAG: hypothetical protein LBP23_06825, partial [Treponema sp.]|nr:hypothetical protein [Treponema sp.]
MAYEIKARAGREVVVLNPGKLALIYGSMKKTDKEDSLKLARLIEMMRDEQLTGGAAAGQAGDAAEESDSRAPEGGEIPDGDDQFIARAVCTPGDNDGGKEGFGDGGEAEG